jgi:hypothetical protein
MRIYDEKDNEIPDVGYTLLYDAETGKKFGQILPVQDGDILLLKPKSKS